MAAFSTSFAGTATYDFTDDPTLDPSIIISSNNDQIWQVDGGNTGGFLALTYPQNDMRSTVIFPDIDPGQVVTAFRFEADLRIGNSVGARAADGFSISFARANDPVFSANFTDPVAVINAMAVPGAPENGTSTGIAISFDTWAGNALPDGRDFPEGAENDPGGIIVRVDNVTVLRQPLPLYHGACDDPNSLQTGPRDQAFWDAGGFYSDPASWATLCWQPVSVELDAQGQLTVMWKGETVLDHYQTTYFPSPGQLVLSGRTGGANEHTHFDNIELTTTAATPGEKPPTPENFDASFVGARRVNLEWDALTNRVSYQVERDGVEISGTLLQTNVLVDLNVVPGTTYTYVLRSVDASQAESDPVTNIVTTPSEVASSAGSLLAQIYDNLPGAGNADLFNATLDPKFPNSPDRVRYVNGLTFGEPALGNTYGDNLLVRIAGTLTVPETGEYHFFIRSDDASDFYLNGLGAAIPTTETAVPIAQETDCCDPFVEPNVFNDDGLTSPTTTTPIQLTAGQQYGFLYLVKEGGGGDWGQVAMRRVGDPTPASALRPIGGMLVTGAGDPTGASINITAQPQTQTVGANQTVTFNVAANVVSPYGAPAFYQWYRNGTLISGATSTNLTVPFVTAADNNASFTVRVGTLGTNVLSSAATLTVGTDTTAPTVTEVSGSASSALVVFSEPINATTGAATANYQISGGATITSATVVSAAGEAGSVRLALSGTTAGQSYDITVSGVTDLAGNAVASTTRSFVAYSIFANFNDGQLPPGVTVVGAANIQSTGGIDNSGHAEITRNAGSLGGSVNFDDALEGGTVNNFTVRFKLFIGNGSGNPADGFSFNIASDLLPDTNTGEEGAGTGLTIAFDTYDNGAAEAPAIDVKWGGAQVEGAHATVAKADLVNNEWVDVIVQVDTNGLLTVIHDNVTYFEDLDIGYAPIAAPRLTFGARTGGEFAAHRIDDVAAVYNANLDVGVQPEITSISRTGNQITIEWTGGGTLEASDTLGATANWAAVTGAGAGTATVTVGTGNRFFRVTQ